MPKSFVEITEELVKFGRNPNDYPIQKVTAVSKSPMVGVRSLMFKSIVKGEANDYLTFIQFFNVDFAKGRGGDFQIKAKVDGKTVWHEVMDPKINTVKLKCSCFTGDTLIPLADGTSVPIKDLVDKEEFFVYSFDREADKIVIGRGHTCEVKEENANLVEVTIDNGKSIRCTPDHKFLLRNGQYKEAQDLVEGESLQPLYRSPVNAKYMKGLGEQVFQNDGTWDINYWSVSNHHINTGLYNKPLDIIKERFDINQLVSEAEQAVLYNHKVVSVKVLEEKEDVYCFTVDKHHNFAVDLDDSDDCSSGLIVKNCPDFRFRFEKELFDNKALVGTFRKYTPVPGSNRGPVNPKELMGYCKHTYALYRTLDREGLIR